MTLLRQPPPMNIVELLHRQARLRPHAAAFVTANQVISYLEAHERVLRMAGALAQRGIEAGQHVAVRLPNSPTAVLAFLALARLGAVAVTLPARRPAEQLAQTVSRLRIGTTIGLGAEHELPGTRFIAADDSLLKPLDEPDRARPPAAGGDAVLCLSMTSGTTGESKCVAWTHARKRRLWEAQLTDPFNQPGERGLVLMGFDAMWAMQAVLRMLFSGATVVVVPDVGLRAMAEGVDRLGARHVISSPAFMGRMLRDLPDDRPRFPDLRTLRLGGSTVPPAVLARLRRQLTPNIVISYGSTECSLIALADPVTLERAPTSVGVVVPWVEVQVLDDEGRALPAGRSGTLRFRSDVFTDGYFEDPAATAAQFHDGWFQPGDHGRLDPDGTLVIESRIDDLINVGGLKVNPGEIEAVLLQDPAILDCAAYAVVSEVGEPVLLAAVVTREALDSQAVLKRCHASLGPKTPRHLVRLDQLPRNANGKLLRQVLQERTKVGVARSAPASTAGTTPSTH